VLFLEMGPHGPRAQKSGLLNEKVKSVKKREKREFSKVAVSSRLGCETCRQPSGEPCIRGCEAPLGKR